MTHVISFGEDPTISFFSSSLMHGYDRPETVESLFIAYRLTGDRKYREQGWKIFQAIEKYCKVESGGYASILNVEDKNSIQMDKMETFFLVSPC